jgi:phosphatidylserine decarboxylase
MNLIDMKIHKEGSKIILFTFLLLAALNLLVFWLSDGHKIWLSTALVVTFVLFLLVVQFFRVPRRRPGGEEIDVLSPADGKVVAIEEVQEGEYLKDKRIQVSIFMSPLNVHVNYNPISGIVRYVKYHPGLFLVAWHPKSSTDNERTTIVVENSKGQQVLYRQIAGAVARRIVHYLKEGMQVKRANEFGFIKFGSRVDVLLPVDSEIVAKIGDKTRGSETIIARLK